MQLPVLTGNIIYDMDSTTSPSSLDSVNSPRRNKPQSPAAKNLEVSKISGREEEQKQGQEKKPAPVKVIDRHHSSRPVRPLKEISSNQIGSSASISKSKQTSSAREPTSRGRPRVRSKLAVQHKRWV